MVDLVQWLTACLDTDAARAKAAGGDSWRRQDHPSETVAIYDSQDEPVVYDEGWPTEEQQAHIAAWDPARVLREIDAKRRIIAAYENYDREAPELDIPESVLRLLAAVYADRPGYREEWAL